MGESAGFLISKWARYWTKLPLCLAILRSPAHVAPPVVLCTSSLFPNLLGCAHASLHLTYSHRSLLDHYDCQRPVGWLLASFYKLVPQ